MVEKIKKRKWLKELPYIRGIAALGILIIHATGNFVMRSEFGSGTMNLGIFLNQFFRFGSPVFMMISGMVIFYNYRSREALDKNKFYNKKIRNIFIPYLIWNLIYYFRKFRLEISYESLRTLFFDILLGRGYVHLYFIFLIFQFYILVPWLLSFLPEEMEKRPCRLIGLSFLFQFLIISYSRYFMPAVNEGFIYFYRRFYWKTVLAWQYYFILGGTIGVHYFRILDWIKENWKKIKWIFFLTSLVYVGQVYYSIYKVGSVEIYEIFGSLRPTTMVFASVTILFLLGLSHTFVGKSEILKDIGIYSFGIYFSHPLILDLLNYYLFRYSKKFSYGRILSLIIFVVLGILLSLLSVFFLGSLRSRKLIMGNVPKFTLNRWREEE